MVRIGTVGIGFMGMTHYIACKKVHGGKVTAICTRSEKKLQGDWRDIQGNFGLRGQMEDLSEVRKYQEIDRLLADPGIDLVDICLPTQYHKEVTLKALRAGKHVLLEKPIAIRLSEADEMVATAREMGRHFMVAHVVPFVPEYAFARQAVESGEYGPLLGARFKRTTATYTRPPDPAYLERSGGPGIDLHIHDTHFIQLLCGVPNAVVSRGRLIGGDYLQYVETQYFYPGRDVAVSCISGSMTQRPMVFTHGFEVFLERATLLYSFSTLKGEAVSSPLTLIDGKGEVSQPRLESTDPIDAFVGEIQYAVDSIRQGTAPVALSGEGARAALDLCWKEAESVKTGRIVTLDP